MREGICSGLSLRFLEEYHLLEKVGPGEVILVLVFIQKTKQRVSIGKVWSPLGFADVKNRCENHASMFL